MVTISPVFPATATVEPSGEATEAYSTQVQVPLGQDVAGADVDHPPVHGGAVAGDLVDHRGAPVPDRGDAACAGTSKGSPRVEGSRRRR